MGISHLRDTAKLAINTLTAAQTPMEVPYADYLDKHSVLYYNRVSRGVLPVHRDAVRGRCPCQRWSDPHDAGLLLREDGRR